MPLFMSWNCFSTFCGCLVHQKGDRDNQNDGHNYQSGGRDLYGDGHGHCLISHNYQ